MSPSATSPVSASPDPTSPRSPGPAAVSTAASTDELDLEISVAYISLAGARGLFDRCPSGENQQRADEAEDELNRLLDLRLAVRPAA